MKRFSRWTRLRTFAALGFCLGFASGAEVPTPENPEPLSITPREDRGIRLDIPVTFLPNWEVVEDESGNESVVVKEGNSILSVPAHKVALMIMDMWNIGEGDKPGPFRTRVLNVLTRARENGMTVIHSPNRPVVDRYPIYWQLKRTVENFLKPYGPPPEAPEFLNWPPRGNETFVSSQQIREDGREAYRRISVDRPEIDISKFMRPVDGEFVIATYEQLRYVLWRRGIEMIMYSGGSLNECVLHRDTGINRLAGIDTKRTPLTIVVLEDATSAYGTPGYTERDTRLAMLNYFKQKIAFVGKGLEMEFVKP